ncbi:MAG: radical SAM protein [Thermacetogeniaceae bacterium]
MLISWNTTNACNLKCPHCYREAGVRSPQELTESEGRKLLEGIKRAGFRVVVFSGGEPLLRPDIFDLISYARSLGLRPVCGTNGTLLTPQVVSKLCDVGVAAVGISLDSICPEKHDRFRGVEGAWKATIEGMENCRAAGLPFQIHTTVFNWNYEEIEELTELAVEKGAKGHHVFFFVPAGRGREGLETVSPEQIEDLLVRLLKRRQSLSIEIKPTCAPQFLRIARQLRIELPYQRGCLAGISYCIVGPEGDVYPCPYMGLKVANVRQTPFDEIWKNNEVFLRLREQEYRGYCGVCDYRHRCGGCRARAFEENGDYLGEDPSCLYGRQQERRLMPLAEKLLVRLQGDMPLTEKPYLALAQELGVDEDVVLKALRWLKAKGIIRRLGAVFDARKLGYYPTLCAVKVPPERIEDVAAVLNEYPEVTHNYLREHEYNLWFTLIAESEERQKSLLEEIRQRAGLEEILNLPAKKMFKIAVSFAEEDIHGAFET